MRSRLMLVVRAFVVISILAAQLRPGYCASDGVTCFIYSEPASEENRPTGFIFSEPAPKGNQNSTNAPRSESSGGQTAGSNAQQEDDTTKLLALSVKCPVAWKLSNSSPISIRGTMSHEFEGDRSALKVRTTTDQRQLDLRNNDKSITEWRFTEIASARFGDIDVVNESSHRLGLYCRSRSACIKCVDVGGTGKEVEGTKASTTLASYLEDHCKNSLTMERRCHAAASTSTIFWIALSARWYPAGPRNVPATIKFDQVRQKSLNGAALSSL